MTQTIDALTIPIEPDGTILMLSAQYLPNLGGVETSLQALADVLTRQKIRVTLLTLRPLAIDVSWKAFEQAGLFTVLRVWVPKFGGFWNRIEQHPKIQFVYHAVPLFLVGLIYLLFFGRRVSFINAHGFVPGIAGGWLKVLFHKPLVVSLHTMLKVVYPTLSQISPVARSLIQSSLNRADRIKVLIHDGIEELIWLGVDQHKVSRLVLPISVDDFRPLAQNQCRQELGIDDRFTVLYVGRLTEQKGIKILPRLAEKFPQMQFLVAGLGPLEQFIQDRVQRMENLRYCGLATGVGLVRLYNSADLVIIPSQGPEGLPMVTKEALACGTPIVTTNLGGLAQYRDCPAAIVSDPSESDLAAALKQMHARLGTSAAAIRAQARQYALAHLTGFTTEDLIGVRFVPIEKKQ